MSASLDAPLFIYLAYFSYAMPVILSLSVILLYDHALTIGDEVRLVWFAPWSKPKALFLFTRYTMLLGAITLWVLIAALPSGVEEILYAARIYLGVLAFLFTLALSADALFLLRVYAIWNQNRNVAYLFAIAVLAQAVNIAWVAVIVSPLRGGIMQTAKALAFTSLGAEVLFNTILFVLVLLKAAQHRILDGGGSPLLHVYYRDGAGYYLALLVVRVVIFIGCAIEDWALYVVSAHVLILAPPVLATRMFLNLRRVHEYESLAVGSVNETQRFSHPPSLSS
ncbi:hypothetical protein BOTBODRAFT_35188 [Botryobasidium botryosum FD-172 SS1]|uniref:DUF6533 domain-containing protein n=1 Tax=Botryobasidium botryosum (strain FD-172 SS1) TaxID=930990 RepID=A0A067M6W3_BOTB1|nr:hypothetical protein BOTBODRAFT_35188 [Botryobasidium botryosum FD-172 SS1]